VQNICCFSRENYGLAAAWVNKFPGAAGAWLPGPERQFLWSMMVADDPSGADNGKVRAAGERAAQAYIWYNRLTFCLVVPVRPDNRAGVLVVGQG